MKKLIAVILCIVLCLCLAACGEKGITVHVVISSEGSLVAAGEEILVTDTDKDGVYTIHDALTCAHDKLCKGGYADAETDFGMSITKLWGVDNGCSGYGYYVDNVGAMSPADPIAEGAWLAAFSYTDLSAWSDTYCFFDTFTAEAKAGEALTLTLSAASFDESYAPITVPVAGAVVTVDGAESAFITDENGAVTVTLSAGKHILSAVSGEMNLVPTACLVSVQ